MKAARFYGEKDIRVEEVPGELIQPGRAGVVLSGKYSEPEPRPGQVKIKIAWCGICGTDIHEYITGATVCPTSTHPTTGEKIPITLGHEMSGTIVALGQGVDGKEYATGRNVVVEPILHCLRKDCRYCTVGLPTLCDQLGIVGLHGFGGGLSSYVALDTRYVHVIPENIPLDIAACIEPLAVAWHAVKRSNFRPEDKCLIVGSGPIGLFVLKVLKGLGCRFLIVSEPAKIRREKALELGADVALDPRSCDVVKEALQQTNGAGVDISYECAGSEVGLATAVAATKARGMIMNIALWEKRPAMDMSNFLQGEKVLTASCCYVDVHKDVIEALSSGKIQGLETLITGKIPIEKVVPEGFEALVNDRENQIKILVHPHHE